MTISISGSTFSGTSMIAQMRQELFNRINQNRDGSLDNSELQSLSGANSSKVDEFIKKLDTDRDSAISQQEFEAGMAKLHQETKSQMTGMTSGTPPGPPPGGATSSGESEDSTSGIFDVLDTNKDGVVSLEELMAGKVPDAEKLFSEIDSDGDGKISRSESDDFEKKMRENDPNGDPQAGMGSLQSMQTEFLTRIIGMITGSSESDSSNSFYA